MTCANCGKPSSQHHLANYADGPNIGESFNVCPTAVFAPMGANREGIRNLCGKPMPSGEEMFRFHGYSGPCPQETP